MNPPPPDPHQRSLSAELIFLAGEFLHHPVELREVIGLLRERAYTLLVFILALPFCLPVSVPGMSTPLGMMIAFITVAQARGRAPRLPERMLRYRLAALTGDLLTTAVLEPDPRVVRDWLIARAELAQVRLGSH